MKKQTKMFLGAVLVISMVSISGTTWSFGAGRGSGAGGGAGAGGGSGLSTGAGAGGTFWEQAGGMMNSTQAQSREFMGLGSADYQRQQGNAAKAKKMTGPQDGSGLGGKEMKGINGEKKQLKKKTNQKIRREPLVDEQR